MISDCQPHYPCHARDPSWSRGTPVILLAHGSRRAGADQQIEQIAAALEAELASPANSDATWHAELASPAPVRAAFLDFSPATLYSVAEELVADGHRHAIVVPLLFTNAFHLNHDVPRDPHNSCQSRTRSCQITMHIALLSINSSTKSHFSARSYTCLRHTIRTAKHSRIKLWTHPHRHPNKSR